MYKNNTNTCNIKSYINSDQETLVSKFSTLNRQFLCCYPINLVNWQEVLKNVSWSEQKVLLYSTVLCELNKEMPVNRNYQLNFLKTIIRTLEERNVEIHDQIYETFCSLISTNIEYLQDFSYKHYLIPNCEIKISLKESKSFVIDGTTGLCTWQAAIALSDYMIKNSELFKHKKVFELGCGTGLCSLIASKYCKAKRLILSDGSYDVIKLLYENVIRNFDPTCISAINTGFELLETENREVCILYLPWNKVKVTKMVDNMLPDIILAADIVYDIDVIPDLSEAINNLFDRVNDNCEMYLAATVRNKDSLGKFMTVMDELNFSYKEIHHTMNDSTLFWDDTTPIKIYFINRDYKNKK